MLEIVWKIKKTWEKRRAKAFMEDGKTVYLQTALQLPTPFQLQPGKAQNQKLTNIATQTSWWRSNSTSGLSITKTNDEVKLPRFALNDLSIMEKK